MVSLNKKIFREGIATSVISEELIIDHYLILNTLILICTTFWLLIFDRILKIDLGLQISDDLIFFRHFGIQHRDLPEETT